MGYGRWTFLPVSHLEGGNGMPRTFFKYSAMIAALFPAVSGRLDAQHSHDHSDPATPAAHGAPTAADPMAGMKGMDHSKMPGMKKAPSSAGKKKP